MTEFAQWQGQHMMQCWSPQAGYDPIPVSRTEGCWIHTADGKKIFDLRSAHECINLGFNHPKVIAALKSQMDRVVYVTDDFAAEKNDTSFPMKPQKILLIFSLILFSTILMLAYSNNDSAAEEVVTVERVPIELTPTPVVEEPVVVAPPPIPPIMPKQPTTTKVTTPSSSRPLPENPSAPSRRAARGLL